MRDKSPSHTVGLELLSVLLGVEVPFNITIPHGGLGTLIPLRRGRVIG